MAIDTSPSAVATDALASIPFTSLIGSPLAAAIKAQAAAAKSTVDFIQAVGLSAPDANGKREAITVVFSYQKGADTVNLMVPLLTIVPIPYIRIDNMNIDFKANISASSSTSSTQSESTSVGGQVSAHASYWFFSVDFTANYSSKKDSTATANSAYSVEYTMDVSVHAIQDAMPAGLAKVLNLLQESIAVADVRGTVNVVADRMTLDTNNKVANLTVTVLDGTNKPVVGADVTVTSSTTAVTTALNPAGAKTDASGRVQVTATLGTQTTPPATKATISVSANNRGSSLDLAIGS